MKTIIHTCSSALVRPNGIVRYINYAITAKKDSIQLFVTDSKPTQHISEFAQVVYKNETSNYTPNFKNNLPNLQVCADTIETIYNLAKEVCANKWHKIIAHDLMSFLAFERAVPVNRHQDIIFVQHESDVMNWPNRYSYINNDWLKQQFNVIANTNATIALTANIVNPKTRKAKNLIYLPVPFIMDVNPKKLPKKYDVLYIGDASDRKNAKEFMRLVAATKLKGVAITHKVDNKLFNGVDTFSFRLDQKEQMYDIMQQSNIAYIPSKNECPSIAMIECLQFMPTVLNANYGWTKIADEFGAIQTETPDLVIKQHQQLKNAYTNKKLQNWCKHARLQWEAL